MRDARRAAGCRPRSRCRAPARRASAPATSARRRTRLTRPCVREPVEAALLAVAGRGREDERQVRAGCRVSRKRRSSARISSSGVPMPTKPETATVSPSRIDRDGFVGGDDLVLEHAAGPRLGRARPASSAMPGPKQRLRLAAHEHADMAAGQRRAPGNPWCRRWPRACEVAGGMMWSSLAKTFSTGMVMFFRSTGGRRARTRLRRACSPGRDP